MDGKQEHPQHQKYVEYIQIVEFYRTKSPTTSKNVVNVQKSIVLVNTQVIRFYVDQRKFVQDERLETFHQNFNQYPSLFEV